MQAVKGKFFMANSRQGRYLIWNLSWGLATAATAIALLLTGGPDGADPRARLTMDAEGNFYGTTRVGGKYGYGTVFKLAHKGSAWILTPLYTFAGGADGAQPKNRVIFGPDRSLYGTTDRGGGGPCDSGCGTVFKLTPPATACKSAVCSWTKTLIYQFMGGSDGANPAHNDIIFDQAGNIYGTTLFGGPGNLGTVYELMPVNGSWMESVIHSFSGTLDGFNPETGVTLDGAGNLYGTTYYGGTYDAGIVYQLTPSESGWTENILYEFGQDNDPGTNPASGLIFDQSGNLYGATPTGGSGGGGSVFELTPSNGNWTFNVLYALGQGTGPYGTMIMDAAGNLYGTTYTIGAYGYGSVFKLAPSGGGWAYTDLYDFTGGSDGGYIWAGLVMDANDNLYGAASSGGAYGNGVVFEVTP